MLIGCPPWRRRRLRLPGSPYKDLAATQNSLPRWIHGAYRPESATGGRVMMRMRLAGSQTVIDQARRGTGRSRMRPHQKAQVLSREAESRDRTRTQATVEALGPGEVARTEAARSAHRASPVARGL